MFLEDRAERKKHKRKGEPEDKVLALNSREKKGRNKNSKFFKGECNKCGKYGHRASYCRGKKTKTETKIRLQENPEEWLGNSGLSSHITHKKKDMTDVETCNINVTVGNAQ